MSTVTRRRSLLVVLAIAVGAGLFLALLHTPFGRGSVLELASDLIDDRYHVQLQAERLDYNLLTLDFELTNLSLATSETYTPFFSAGRVHVDLPWSAVTGRLMLTAVDVDGAMLSLIQSTDGGWNLPTSRGDEDGGTEAPLALPPIERVDLTDLGVSVQATDYDVAAEAVSVHLATGGASSAALVGPLNVAQPIQIRWRDQRTSIDQLDAQLAFDGGNLDLEPLELDLPEGHLRVEGRASSLFREPTLDLSYRADVVLSRAATWWRPDHGVNGQAVARGLVTGPVGALHVTAEMDTSSLQWAEVSDLTVRATARLEPGAFVVDSATASFGDGRLDVSGRVALVDPPEPSRVEAAWRNLDTLAVVRQLDLGLPYAPAGIVSGHGLVTWTEWSPQTIRFETEITSRAHEDQVGTVPFGGMARLQADGGRWVAELDDLSLPGFTVGSHVEGQLPSNGGSLADTTLVGDVVVDASDLARVAKTFALPGLVGNATRPGVTGTARAEFALTGAVVSPVAEGRILDAHVGYRGIERIDIRSTFIADRGGVLLDELTAAFGPNLVAGSVRVDLDADTVDGSLDVRLSDVSALAPALPAVVAPTGSLDAHATISGPLGAPHLEAQVEGREMTVGNRTIDQLTATMSLDDGVFRIETLEARQHAGLAQLRGSYAMEDGTYELDATGRALRLESLAADTAVDSNLSGQMRFDITSRGSFSDPSGTGTVRIDALGWSGRSLGVADIALEIEEGLLRLNAGIPSLNATAQAEVGVVHNTAFAVTADLVRTELDRVLGPASGDSPLPEVGGIASLQLTVSGNRTSLADTRMMFEVRELEGLIGPTRLRLADPGSVEYAEGEVTTERLELLLDDTRLTLAGSLNKTETGRLTATMSGDLSDFEPVVTIFGAKGDSPPSVELAGAIDAEIVVTGSFDEPTVTTEIQIRSGTVALGELPAAQDLDIDLRYDTGAVRLERLSASWQGASLSGQGELPTALLEDRLPTWLTQAESDTPIARFTLNADGLTAAALEPFVDPASLEAFEGRSTARLDVEAEGFTVGDIRARLTFDEIDLTVAGIPLAQSRPTEAELTDGLLTVRSLAWGGLSNELSLGGTIDLRTEEPTVDMTLTGEGDLRLLGALVGGGATAGRAFTIVNFQGTTSEPVIRGTVEISDAELRVANPPLLVTELAGTVWLEGDRIRTYEMAGLANGGEIEIDGAFQLEVLRPAGAVTFTGREVAMEVPEGLRTEVDTSITLDTTGPELRVSGTVTILRGDYRQTLALTAGLLDALQQGQELTVIGQDETSALEDVQLNVRVVSEDDIVVDNNYANGEIGLDLPLGWHGWVPGADRSGIVERRRPDPPGQQHLRSRVGSR